MGLCDRLDEVSHQELYKREFAWIDHYRPVTEAERKHEIEEYIVSLLQAKQTGGLLLAAPEMIEWERVSGFHFHFDKSRVFHDPLRIQDLLNGLDKRGELEDVTATFLKEHRITMIDGDGIKAYSWPIWNCLVGELEHDGDIFLVEEGQLFWIDPDYMAGVNEWIDSAAQLPHTSIPLPLAKRGEEEKDYNKRAALAVSDCLLLDRRNVRLSGETPIELSDLLTKSGDMVHVKRRGGARELSHLFSQGAISALAINAMPAMRREAQRTVNSVDQGGSYDLLDEASFDSRKLRVVFVLIDDVEGRSRREALPFFSRLNLRRHVQEIRERGYAVAYCRVGVEA